MNPSPASLNPLYRAVWRWHFFAGLFVAPFAIFLALTGGVYLWKPQFEEWRYRDLFHAPAGATTVSADAQFAAGRAAHPELNAQQFVPAPAPSRTAEIIFGGRRGSPVAGENRSVYVNPYTGTVVGEIADANRPMSVLRELHGTLLAGLPGELLVELAASWAFVLLATGLYLWWPRPFTVRGFLLPRLGAGRRALLRDLHAVPAVWLSGLILLLLATGIQWTKVGGKWSRTIAQVAGEWQPRETSASAHRSELLGGWSPFMKDKTTAEMLATVASTPPASDDPHAEHHGHHGGGALHDDPAHPRISLERVMSIARERQVTDPYAIALPTGELGVYSIITDRNRAFTRAYIHLDQYSGKVLADVRFKDFGFMAKFYTFGIIWHEGQLFGLVNQIIGTITAAGVILLAVTGVAMWWSRRPRGELAAPVAPPSRVLPKGVFALTLVLAALLPLMAATLLLLFLCDRLLAPLFPWFRSAT